MAQDKPKEAKVEEVVRVVSGRTVDERISALISEQKGHPDPASIEIHEQFVDVFAPPKWCNTVDNAYAWIDPKDDTQLDRAINYNYWQIVTRGNHPGANSSDFRVHGAVERRGLILVFRPMDLEKRLRYLGVKKHQDMFAAQMEPTKGQEWTKTAEVGEDVPSSGFKPFAGEKAGSEGIEKDDSYPL